MIPARQKMIFAIYTMANGNADKSSRPGRAKQSLRRQLLIAVNISALGMLVAFVIWDYRIEWRTRLQAKRIALEEEAKTLLPAVLQEQADREFLQNYIDTVSAHMRDTTSPGHQIAIRIGGIVIQARSNNPRRTELFHAMLDASHQKDGLGFAEGSLIIVGHASSEDIAVYISEYIDDIQRVQLRQVARRILNVFILGAILVVVINILIERMVNRPLNSIVDVVRKVSSGELGTRVPSPRTSELGFLADEFNSMSAALEVAESARRRKMEKARQIQENLIPRIESDIGLKVTYVYEPAKEVAGDYFDVRRKENGVYIFCIADVAGHDVPAAMGCAMLKTLFSAASAQTSDPGRILESVNKGFAAVSLSEDFATMTVISYDCHKQKVRYVSAGHEITYLVPKDSETRRLVSTGPPIGIPESIEWDVLEMSVNVGDRLVMLTDGIAETMSPSEDVFGRERLSTLIEECRGKPLEELRHKLLSILTDFRDGAHQGDDVTLMAVEF